MDQFFAIEYLNQGFVCNEANIIRHSGVGSQASVFLNKEIVTATVILIGTLEDCDEAVGILERKKIKKIEEIQEVDLGCPKVIF